MYKRLTILSVMIFGVLAGLVWLGHCAIEMQGEGLAGRRIGEFAEVAEQVRRDVMRKLDDFIQVEQDRPYTDYQYYHVPENIANVQQQMLMQRSPIGATFDNEFARGYFNIDNNSNINTPYYSGELSEVSQQKEESQKIMQAKRYVQQLNQKLLPMLGGESKGVGVRLNLDRQMAKAAPAKEITKRQAGSKKIRSRGKSGEFPIKSLQSQSRKSPQVYQQQRALVASNTAIQSQQIADESQVSRTENQGSAPMPGMQAARMGGVGGARQVITEQNKNDMVQIRVEPFVPLIVPAGDDKDTLFDGQVFLLRHVQVENNHFLQGFQLNEEKLIEKVRDSAGSFIREGMSFELSQGEDETSAYTAVLDFGFGNLFLNLSEIDPGWIGRQVSQLRNWYFSIIAIVFIVIILAMVGLWRSLQVQVALSRKKDDFISAVSHELRTPLTAIRMYAEMLENNWIKSPDKCNEYYRSMRQESERLSRLIENVLDFSRIQRKQKKYNFQFGDINECIAEAVDTIGPYARQGGFVIEKQLQSTPAIAYDKDSVVQIVINLVDNAIKYCRDADDKRIVVRTRAEGQYVLIEIEDHGPGIPRNQRRKVFDEFYRCQNESTRETTGTGLGLALVNKFAQAHNGFVEILSAKPNGAILRVAIATQR